MPFIASIQSGDEGHFRFSSRSPTACRKDYPIMASMGFFTILPIS